MASERVAAPKTWITALSSSAAVHPENRRSRCRGAGTGKSAIAGKSDNTSFCPSEVPFLRRIRRQSTHVQLHCDADRRYTDISKTYSAEIRMCLDHLQLPKHT